MQVTKLRSSGEPPKKSAVRNAAEIVLVADDGNCFMEGDTNRTQSQHLGERLLSKEQIVGWQDILRRRHSLLAAKDIRYLFLLGPDKQSVFWESLQLDRLDNRNSLSIFNESLGALEWVDPVPALRKAAGKGVVCALTDSHWDMRGAYVAYRELMLRLPSHSGKLLVEGEDFDFVPRDISGDLGNKFKPQRFATSNGLKRKKMTAKRVYFNGVDRNGSVAIYAKKGLSNVGILCGDSYTQALSAYVAEHFGVLVHIRGSTDPDFIASLCPEVAIGELGERFFFSPPVSSDDAPVEMFFIRRLTRKEMKSDVFERVYSALSHDGLPAPLLAMVRRNDALGDMLRSDTPTERQRIFMTDMFDGATSGDILTACYLSWAWDTAPEASWTTALEALPRKVQDEFRSYCRID